METHETVKKQALNQAEIEASLFLLFVLFIFKYSTAWKKSASLGLERSKFSLFHSPNLS